MKKIDVHYISNLLYHHDCVIIPDLGGFIANYQTAEIHSVNHSFSPPSKSIFFNQNIKTNDGLLIHHIAIEEKISYEEAKEKLSSFVLEIKNTLHNEGNFTLENLGTLKLNKEGDIIFENEKSINYLKASYGLYDFTPAVVSSKAKIFEHPTKKVSIKKLAVSSMKWAAILLPLILLGFLVKMNTAYLNDLNKQITKYFEPPTTESIVENQISQAGFLPMKSARKEPIKPIPVIDIPAKTLAVSIHIEETPEKINDNKVITPNTELRVYQNKFHIIVGAFRVKTNAVKLNKKLVSQDYNSRIIDITPGGLYRVSIQSYSSREQGVKALRQIKTEGYSGAWMMIRSDIPENVVQFI